MKTKIIGYQFTGPTGKFHVFSAGNFADLKACRKEAARKAKVFGAKLIPQREPPPNRKPEAHQFKLREKLQALAKYGINGEKANAADKLARLEARYDFAAHPDPDAQADIFAGCFQRSTIAAQVFHFTEEQNDVAANVKWAIEHATGISCLFRDRDLYAEAAPSSADKLREIAGIVTAGFDRLWATIAAVPTITPGDRPVFHAGLYDGMMGERREGLLPSRPARAARRCGRRKEIIPTVAMHPYTTAYGLGQQIRFNVPLAKIAGDLEQTVKAYLT